MKSTTSTMVGWLLRLAVGVLLLVLVWRSIDSLKIGELLESFDLPTITLSLLIVFSSWLLASCKWRLLLPSAPLALVTRVTFVSQFYGFLLPGQLGAEISRAVLMARLRDDTDRSIASVFVDRVTGLVGLCLVALAGIGASSSALATAFGLPFALVGIAAAASLFILRVSWVEAAVRRGVGRLLSARAGWLRASGRFLSRAHDALAAFASDGRLILASVAMGVLFQLLCVLLMYLLASRLGIDVSVFDLAWVFGVVSIALLLPISIAGIGVRELTFVGLLGWMGVPAEKSLVLSLAVLALTLCGALVGAALEAARLFSRPRA